jgi:hypothetical protein
VRSWPPRSGRLALAALIGLLGHAGCGLGVTGTGASGAGEDGGTGALDGSATADAGSNPDADVTNATCTGLPSNWGLVALVAGGTACPDGYTADKLDLHAGPSPHADACTCGCTLDSAPACTRATGATYDNDGSHTCGIASSYGWADVTNGTCATDMWPGPYTTSHDWKWPAPTRTGGTCTATPDKHLDRIDFAATQTACVPNAGCAGAPAVTAPTRRCLAADGDLACPSGSFANRRVLDKGYDLTCAGPCGCAVTGTCNAGVTLYEGSSCSGTSHTMIADGACQQAPATASIASYRYTATVTAPGCSSKGTATVTATTPVGTMTLCCE